jgi:hypothetical protein
LSKVWSAQVPGGFFGGCDYLIFTCIRLIVDQSEKVQLQKGALLVRAVIGSFLKREAKSASLSLCAFYPNFAVEFVNDSMND